MPLKRAKGSGKKARQSAVSANVRELRKAHPEWSQDRVVAASIHAARGKKGA